MSNYPGKVTKVILPSGTVWEYWYGTKNGKRFYLTAKEDSLNTWEFSSAKEVKSFIASQE